MIKSSSIRPPLLRSHTDPDKLLIEHLEEVGTLSREIVSSKKIKDVELFADISYLIGISHDFGKATTYFQEKLSNGSKTQYADHSFISALFGYYLINNLFPTDIYSLYGFIAIWGHHGNLKSPQNIVNRFREIKKGRDSVIKKPIADLKNNDLLTEIYNHLLGEKLGEKISLQDFYSKIDNGTLVEEIKTRIKNELLYSEGNIKHYFSILFFYSVLLDADKLSSCGYTKIPLDKNSRHDLGSKLVDNYVDVLSKKSEMNIDKLRAEAYGEAITNLERVDLDKNRVLILNLPTGLGKTLTSMSVAVKLRKKINDKYNFLPKIIYSAPFLSILDQNKKVFENVLREGGFKEIPSNLLIEHHHLSDISYKENEGDEKPLPANIAMILIEGWHSEIVVTTFMQLFYSLVTNHHTSARKFHNIVNSIIILDELQTIPVRYWKFMREIINYLTEDYNCFFISMSATHPLIFTENVYNLIQGDYLLKLDRYDIIFDSGNRSVEDFKCDLIEKINQSKYDVMIILNTKRSAKDVYNYVKEHFVSLFDTEPIITEEGICEFKNLKLIFLSADIIPFHRLKRIEKIKDKEDKKRKIIVTTQVVEAGVDISVPIVLRDFCPFDSIIQSAGRCNRHFELPHKGEVKIVKLKDDGRDVCSYIYDPVLIDVTECTLENIFQRAPNISEKKITEEYVKYSELLNERVRQINIKNDIEKLNFDVIREFKLIENERRLPFYIDIFVEINSDAENCLEKYKKSVEDLREIKRKSNKNIFKHIAEIEKIRRELYKYVVSISLDWKSNLLDELEDVIEGFNDLKIIKKDGISKYYNIETGPIKNDTAYDII